MIRPTLVKSKTYKEWFNDTLIDKSWMIAPEFFLGMPIKTTDSPIDAVMRASVYSYVMDTFGGRRLGLRDTTRWSELFRARLIEVNGSFWKQFQMDQLLRIADMVTADYSEFSQDYNRGTSASKSENTGLGENKYVGHDLSKSKTDPNTTTITDRTAPGKQTTTTTPTKAAQQVQLNSVLAESSYEGAAMPGSPEYTNGMPNIDTTHGDSMASNWNISEANKVEVEMVAPTGDTKQEQSEIKSVNEGVNSGSNTNSSANTAFVNAINDSISGSQRVGHRDYNGYNLTASITAVQSLLPHSYLNSALSSLFSGMQEVLDEEGNNLWL